MKFCCFILLVSTLAANEKFSFPDEWESHQGTIMIFPAKHSYLKKANKLQREFAEIANKIQKREQVYVFTHVDDLNSAKKLLDPEVKLVSGREYRIDWARDNSPMIVRSKSGKRKAVCFEFNGWGKKYDGWQNDRGVNLAIARELNLPIVKSDLVLEGGAIEIGSGPKGLTGILTEQCVLNPNRTDWNKQKVEKELKEKLGLDHLVWIPKGLNPDPITDGHVDGLLKFIRKDTVLLHTTDFKKDINYKNCQIALKILKKEGFKVIELPLADDIVHMNFYIGSGGTTAYVPICGDPKQDNPALKIIGKFFKEVIPVKSVAISEAGGGIHCYTMQIPAKK